MENYIAITSLNLSLYESLREYTDIPLSTVCLGHSLGEYSALYASGVISLKDTLVATLHRGIIMNQVSQNHPGAMYAIIGTEVSVIEDGIDRLSLQERVSIANDNSPHQQVISGDLEAIGSFIQWLRSEIQSVKTIKLQVSGAWHSPLMKKCTVEFSGILDKIVFELPERSVIMNVTGNYENNPIAMKDHLVAQIHSRVQWQRSILRVLTEGFNYYIEIGPRRILGNLLREIAQDKFEFQYKNIETMNDLSKL